MLWGFGGGGRRPGGIDRSRVSGNDAYEVASFAKKYGITQAQARALIKKHGNSRKTLAVAAKRLAAS
jgi:Protein of unknown function (DUF3606)